MRLQIDTERKEIHLLEAVQLSELWAKLNDLFPHEGWRGYSINIEPTITWVSPPQSPIGQIYPYPWWGATYIDSTDPPPLIPYRSIDEGVYNVDM